MADVEEESVESAPMMKSILRFLLAVLILILPCLSFAEEPKPTIIAPACGAVEPNYVIQVADTVVSEPDYSRRAPDVIPNDPYYEAQWNLDKIEAPAAWEITTGSDEVVIAVIGTGVDLDHPELEDKIWTNPGEIPGNGIDDDGNGYKDDVHGWDFVHQHGEPQDDYVTDWLRGHGTLVATIAAAETNNGIGITGLSCEGETTPILTEGATVLSETSLGSLGSVTITLTTANGAAAAKVSKVPGMARSIATSDFKIATTTVEFEPGLPYTVTLAAYPTSLAVGDTSTLTATVKDQDNNDVADGTVVTFETSLGSLGSSPVTKTTVSGVATATLTSQIAGTAVVTATSDSKHDTTHVTFNPGPPYTITAEAYPTSIPIRGSTSMVTSTVKDQYSNLVADGTVVTFATDLGSLDWGSSNVVKNTVSGVATATLTSGSIMGTANITASADSVVGQTQVGFIWNGGIAGVSWGGQIMPIKVLDQNGWGYINNIVCGIMYAADNEARIIILDFQVFDYYLELEAVVDYVYQKGTLLVAGAGNCGAGGGTCPGKNPVMYPGAFPHVLAVAATSQADKHMFFSEYHPYVDIAAPGERIPACGLDEYYAHLPGTDLAAAQVAGLAALIWSVDPALTNNEVESIIKSTAVDLGEPCKDDYFGYGRIDANAAVRAALHYLHVEPSILEFHVYDCITPPLQTLTSASPCTWSVTASTPWLSISSSEGYTTTVSINTDSLLDYGVHCATITAISTLTNCVSYSQTIPVTAVYTQCWRSCLPLLLKEP